MEVLDLQCLGCRQFALGAQPFEEQRVHHAPGHRVEHQPQELVHLHGVGLGQRQAGALEHAVADRAVGRVLLELVFIDALLRRQCARRGFAPPRHIGLGQTAELARRVMQLAMQRSRGGLGGIHQLRSGHHGVDDAQRQRACGVDRLAGQQQLHRVGKRRQPRQALRAAGAGQQAPAHLGHAQLQSRVIGHQPLPASQCQLQPTAECNAVDGGHPGLAARFQAHELPAQAAAGRKHLLLRGRACALGVAAHHHQVGPGQERGLAGGQHHTVHRRVAVHPVH